MPKMLAVDTKHEQILKEFIDDDTVYELVLKDALPKTCLSQIKVMCNLLYYANTNIDYFPTNFVLQEGILY